MRARPQLVAFRNQKVAAERGIAAIELAFALGFNERFLTDQGIKADDLYDDIEDRKAAFEQQRQPISCCSAAGTS